MIQCYTDIQVSYYADMLLRDVMLGSPDDALRRQPRVAMLSSVGNGGEYYMSSLLPTPRPSLEAQLKDKPPGYQTLHLPIELSALRSLVVATCISYNTPPGASHTIHDTQFAYGRNLIQ